MKQLAFVLCTLILSLAGIDLAANITGMRTGKMAVHDGGGTSR